MQAMFSGAKGKGKGNQYQTWDYGSKGKGKKGDGKGSKGKGKGSDGNSWRADGGDICSRCGLDDHTAAWCIHLKTECTRCHKTGHTEDMCKTVLPNAAVSCKCCGNPGHSKKECEHRQENCGKCGKVGHLTALCHGKGAQKTPKDTEAAPSISTGPRKLVWACTCGLHHYEESKTCKCSLKRAVYPSPAEAAAMQTSQPKQYVTLKAVPIQVVGKWLSIDADGPAPTKEEEEQQAAKHRLEVAIEAMEALADPSLKEGIDKQKAILAKMIKKMPAPSAQTEKAIMHTGLAELEGKYAAALDTLKVAGEKHLEQQAKDAKAEEKAKKELEEAYAHNVEVIKKTWEAAKAATTKKIQDNVEEIAQCQQQREEAFAKCRQALGKIEATLKTEQIGGEAKEMTSAAVGVTYVPTAPGHILHSNDISPDQLHIEAMSALGANGASPDLVGAIIQVVLTSMKTKATEITTAAKPQQQQQQTHVNGAPQPQQMQQQQKQQEEQFHALQDAAFAAGAKKHEAATSSISNQAEAGMSLEQQMEQDLLTDDTGDEAETARANAKPGDIDVVKKIKKSEKSEKKAKRAKK